MSINALKFEYFCQELFWKLEATGTPWIRIVSFLLFVSSYLVMPPWQRKEVIRCSVIFSESSEKFFFLVQMDSFFNSQH